MEAVARLQVVGDCSPVGVEDEENVGVALPRSHCCKRKRKPLQDITHLMSDIYNVRPLSPALGMQPLSDIPCRRGSKKIKATVENVLGHKMSSLRKSFR